MTIKHHLTDHLLMGYAAGNLPEAFNLIVASHVSMCDDCRARLESFEALGGTVLNDTIAAQAEMAPGSLDDCLAKLDGTEQVQPEQRDLASYTLPAPLRDYVGGDRDAIRWKSVGGGVKQAILATSASASARLLYIPAGAAVPDHGHRGMELTMVLQGAFSDETDRFGRGDVEIADEDLEHMPVAEPGEDCICLAVTDAPLRFRSWLPRLAQPFLKI